MHQWPLAEYYLAVFVSVLTPFVDFDEVKSICNL